MANSLVFLRALAFCDEGVPLTQVRDLLGHASITTTERCDNQKLENLQAAAARLETDEDFEPSPASWIVSLSGFCQE